MSGDILYKKEALQQSLDKTILCVQQAVKSFGNELINKVPFTGSWTAAQVADHITRSNNSISKALMLKGSSINRDPGERIPELKEIFLDFTTKLNAPEFILPDRGDYTEESVLARLGQSFTKIKGLSNRAELSEIINHPAFGDITKFEILYFVLYHTQRHIHQLENIYHSLKHSSS